MIEIISPQILMIERILQSRYSHKNIDIDIEVIISLVQEANLKPYREISYTEKKYRVYISRYLLAEALSHAKKYKPLSKRLLMSSLKIYSHLESEDVTYYEYGFFGNRLNDKNVTIDDLIMVIDLCLLHNQLSIYKEYLAIITDYTIKNLIARDKLTISNKYFRSEFERIMKVADFHLKHKRYHISIFLYNKLHTLTLEKIDSDKSFLLNLYDILYKTSISHIRISEFSKSESYNKKCLEIYNIMNLEKLYYGSEYLFNCTRLGEIKITWNNIEKFQLIYTSRLIDLGEEYIFMEEYKLGFFYLKKASYAYQNFINNGENKAQSKSQLAYIFKVFGQSHEKLNQHTDALKAYKRSSSLYKELAIKNKEYRLQNAIIFYKMAILYFIKNSNELGYSYISESYNIYQDLISEGLVQYKECLAELLHVWSNKLLKLDNWTTLEDKIIESCRIRLEVTQYDNSPRAKQLLQKNIDFSIYTLIHLIPTGHTTPQRLFNLLAEFNGLQLRKEIAIQKYKENLYITGSKLTKSYQNKRITQIKIDQLRLQKSIRKSYDKFDTSTQNQRQIDDYVDKEQEINWIQHNLEKRLMFFNTIVHITSLAVRKWLYRRSQNYTSAYTPQPATLIQRAKAICFKKNIPKNRTIDKSKEAIILISDVTTDLTEKTSRKFFALLLTADENEQYIDLPNTWFYLTNPNKTGRGFRLSANQSKLGIQAKKINFTELHPQMMTELWSKLSLDRFGHIHLVVQGKKASTLPWQASLQLAYPSLVGNVSLHAGISLLPLEDTNHTRDKTPAWPQDWRILGYGENYHYHLHDELPMACLEATLWRKHVSTNTQAPLFENMGSYVHQAGLNNPVAWVLCVHGDASTDFPHAARLKIAPQQKIKGQLLEGDSNAFVDVSDLMRHEQAPLWVYLSACVAGTVTEQATDPTGLPIGFLLNNTQLVIGSNQALDDVWACVLSILFLDRLLTFKQNEPEVQLRHIRMAFEQARSALLDGRLAIYNPDLRQDWQATLQQARYDQSNTLHQRFLGVTDSIFHALDAIPTLPENAEFNLQTYNAVIAQQVSALQERMLISDKGWALLNNLGKRYFDTIQHCQNHSEIREALQEVPIMGTDVVLMKDYITQLIDWTTPDYYKKDMRCPVPQEAIETAASMVVFG